MNKVIARTAPIWITLTFLLCTPAFALPVLIENASFELSSGVEHTDIFGNKYTRSIIDGWDYNGNPEWGIWSAADSTNYSDYYSEPAPDGDYIAYLNNGSIYQDLDWEVRANNIFTVSIDIGNRADDVPFPDSYGVELWAGDNLLVSDGSLVPGEGLFESLVLNYTVLEGDLNIGSNLGIRIFSEGMQLNFDNLWMTNDPIKDVAPVPEPATILLIGSGLAGIAGFQRRKTKFSQKR